MVSEGTAFVEASGQEDADNYVIMSFVICALQQKTKASLKTNQGKRSG
jgi:flagellar basal body-associated protein FliL